MHDGIFFVVLNSVFFFFFFFSSRRRHTRCGRDWSSDVCSSDLSNLLIEAKGNQLSLTGTDLEVELVGLVELQELIEEGEITVPGKKLLEICRSLPDGAQIELSLEGQQLLIRSGRSRFSLST